MTFLVQDAGGTVVGANAYVTVAEFQAYHADRENPLVGFTSDQMESAIVRATDYLDQRFRFVGQRTNVRQRTAWPRLDAEDRDENLRTDVPHEIKEACAEYALIALTQELNPAPTRDATGRVVLEKSETVGPISESTVYGNGGALMLPEYPVADQRLRATGLVVGSGTLRRA